jgi:hypothetical protein
VAPGRRRRAYPPRAQGRWSTTTHSTHRSHIPPLSPPLSPPPLSPIPLPARAQWWALDRDPLCFVWIALSPATRANGAVQAVVGSHKRGLLSRRGHTLSAAHIAELVDAHPEQVADLELQPGEAVLCHNFLVHRSGINTTPEARRGFSVNYIDGRTRVLDPKPAQSGVLGTPGGSFPRVFPSPYANQV